MLIACDHNGLQVVGEPHIRFYAGAPLISSANGYRYGTVIVQGMLGGSEQDCTAGWLLRSQLACSVSPDAALPPPLDCTCAPYLPPCSCV